MGVPQLASAQQARTAGSFIESIGVDTHTYYTDTTYKNFPMVEQRLQELGIHHIRENLVAQRPDQYQHLNELAAAGIKSTLIMGSPENGIGGLNELVGTLDTNLNGAVDAVEGPNEYDLSGDPNWMAKLGVYQAALYADIKSNPATQSLPVLGPALGNTNSVASNISQFMDYGNIHSYPNGEEPELNLSRMFGFASEMSGAKPLIATETGYHTALAYQGEHQPVSEAAEAVYMPRLFLEYFRRGIARTFAYELCDEAPDPAGTEAEDDFGLLNSDFSPKPAFTAVKNLTTILADPGPEFTPGNLQFTLSGDDENLHQVLLQKRDGSYYLALWRAESVWENHARRATTAAAGSVTVNFGDATDSVEEFAPDSSSSPARSIPTAGGAVSVNVGPEVLILRVGGAGGPAHSVGRIKAWASKSAVPAGGTIAVHGRLPVPSAGARVTIQRWHHGWQTVAQSGSSNTGYFRKTVRLTRTEKALPSRFRAVSNQALPSNPVRVRILDRTAPRLGIGNHRSL
jgi:hypothetical protein